MDKQGIYDLLRENGIACEVHEHAAVFTVEEALALDLPRPEAGAKNLFLRDDKKRGYYLLVARDALPVRIKDFQKQIGARPLRFAPEAELTELTGLRAGSVTPFGVLNDTACRVQVYIDAYYRGREISVHPNDNTATVFLACGDLVRLLRAHGTTVTYLDLPEGPPTS